jgi:hypothetical protein
MWTDKREERKQTAVMMVNALGVSAQNCASLKNTRFVVVEEVGGSGELRCVSSAWILSEKWCIRYWNKTVISEVSLLTKCWRMVWKYLSKYCFVWMVVWYSKQKTCWSNDLTIPVAARSKAWVFGRFLARIAGLNSAGGMDVYVLWVLCFVR